MIKTFIIVAASLDGYIGPIEHTNSTVWTSGADKKFFSDRTKEAGVIVMGKTTFDTIGKALPGRRNIVYSPENIDVDGIEITTLPPKELLEKLESEGLKEVAICGGSSIYSEFIRSGCVDKIYVTIEPIVFGNGIPLFKDIEQQKLQLVEATSLGGDAILLEYDIK